MRDPVGVGGRASPSRASRLLDTYELIVGLLRDAGVEKLGRSSCPTRLR